MTRRDRSVSTLCAGAWIPQLGYVSPRRMRPRPPIGGARETYHREDVSRLFLTTLLGLLAVTAPAASAPLVGGPTGSPLHFLSNDLKPRAGGPALPARTTATVLSPDRRRIAALTPTRIVVFARGSGCRLYSVRARGATDVLWPTADRLITLGGSRGEVLRSVALPSGRVRKQVRLGERLGQELHGHNVRVLLGTSTGFRVDAFGAEGRRRHRYRIPLPDGIDPGFARASLRDGLVALSYTTGAVAPYEHALVRLGHAARQVELAGAVYTFVTPDILIDTIGHLARIDRAARRVVREIEVEDGQWVVPFRRGVAIGLGRAVYDRNLDLVAANPHARRGASAPVALGRRLYGRTLRCTPKGQVHAAVAADALTGEIITRRKGPFTIGRLGERLSPPGEDGCD
jgi:hypothetical protein